MQSDYVKITDEPLDLNAIVALVTDPKAGSVSTFLGITRDNFNGKKVLRLEYEAYEPMAVKELNSIAAKIREKWNVIHIALYHRTGMSPLFISSSPLVTERSGSHQRELCRHCHQLRASRRESPSDSLGDRRAQGDCAHLEEGILRGWLSLEGERRVQARSSRQKVSGSSTRRSIFWSLEQRTISSHAAFFSSWCNGWLRLRWND